MSVQCVWVANSAAGEEVELELGGCLDGAKSVFSLARYLVRARKMEEAGWDAELMTCTHQLIHINHYEDGEIPWQNYTGI